MPNWELDHDLATYLLNPENDLLIEFKSKAPGSYKHCEEVSILCEKIGRELKINADLCKILGLYHDIGKMNNPEFFSENQPKNINIHDNLDPIISAYLIQSHVANSIAILSTRVENIDLKIIKCISMHHGDSCLKQFLNKLPKEIQEENKKFFIYPYTKPDNVYACILMICDIIDAKIQSLKSISNEVDTEKVIKETFNQLSNDTLLDELTIKQGRIIVNSLINEYGSIDHKRVPYNNQEK